MSSDHLNEVWSSFYNARTKPLTQRFPGKYRGLVVETNDPLRIHRVQFRCAELHDSTLRPEECQWAMPSFDMGCWHSGSWTHPCIGDWVWIEFEKGHPYAPVWTGFAPPTRRKQYPIPALYGETPIPVDAKSNQISSVKDYDIRFIPKDRRPMSHGDQDRYGHLDLKSSVGFFPRSHDVEPAPTDVDAFTRQQFKNSRIKPEINEPDSKYAVQLSKYGNMILQSDIGYLWYKDGGSGEFIGDAATDEPFEIHRWHYWQRLIHEDREKEKDQRKLLMMTRYGHKLEMRDVGWNDSRAGEFGPQTKIGYGPDERWIKMRSKGGHLIESIDIGCDEIEDLFVKNPILDDIRESSNQDWEKSFGDDARQIRLVARSGNKIVLDDRGSHKTRAHVFSIANNQIGHGILIKGRATPGDYNSYPTAAGDPKGNYLEMNEKPGFNRTALGTPLGQILELNDNMESITLSTRIPAIVERCMLLKDNEFQKTAAKDHDPAHTSHHLIIDLQREAIRLKTRASKGTASESPLYGLGRSGEHAGLEVRDAPAGNAWTEVVDVDNRGIWFSTQNNIGIWRAKKGKKLYVWMDDSSNQIVLHNNEGKIQIFSKAAVEVIGKEVNIQGESKVTIRAGSSIDFQVGGGRFSFDSSAFDTNTDVKGKNILGKFPQIKQGKGPPPGSPSGSGASVEKINEVPAPTVEPSNRL